jgi:hypothetical protein
VPIHHIASWLLKHSDVPVAVLKPVATRIGVSTNHLGAALFAGQLIYENQGAIVEYADRGGVRVGRFLHERAVERYGEDDPLTEYLGENVAALDEAFDGSEEEATTFVEFYRQLRRVDRETPDLSDAEVLAAAKERVSDAGESADGVGKRVTDAGNTVTDASQKVPDPRDVLSGAKRAVDEGAESATSGATGAVGGAKNAVGDPREGLRDLLPKAESKADAETDAESETEDEPDAVEIPVSDAE